METHDQVKVKRDIEKHMFMVFGGLRRRKKNCPYNMLAYRVEYLNTTNEKL
jgi:hypothetical protein